MLDSCRECRGLYVVASHRYGGKPSRVCLHCYALIVGDRIDACHDDLTLTYNATVGTPTYRRAMHAARGRLRRARVSFQRLKGFRS